MKKSDAAHIHIMSTNITPETLCLCLCFCLFLCLYEINITPETLCLCLSFFCLFLCLYEMNISPVTLSLCLCIVLYLSLFFRRILCLYEMKITPETLCLWGPAAGWQAGATESSEKISIQIQSEAKYEGGMFRLYWNSRIF